MKIPFFSKKEEIVQTKPFAPYEEIQEKKTTKLGSFLLIIMVILGVSQGHDFIKSLARNIKSPENISSCGQYLRNLIETNSNSHNYKSFNNYYEDNLSSCRYSALEEEHDIKVIITELLPLSTKATALQAAVNTMQNSSYKLKSKIDTEKRNYDITLQEKMAEENSNIYNKNQIQVELAQDEQEYSRLQKDISQKQSEIAQINNSLKSIALKYRAKIDDLFDDYASQNKWVEFKRALLQLLLITPILFFTVRKYFKQKKENSQYAIIWGAISAIFALLFAEVFIGFIYKIIPHELLKKLIAFFGQFAFMATIIKYLLLLLTPAIFGGIVYLIQKRVYNKEAVMIRALKNHKCPACTMNLREADRYCAVCHYQIKEQCTSCNADRVVGLKFCPGCGVSKIL